MGILEQSFPGHLPGEDIDKNFFKLQLNCTLLPWRQHGKAGFRAEIEAPGGSWSEETPFSCCRQPKRLWICL
jgi:hypothetical protein